MKDAVFYICKTVTVLAVLYFLFATLRGFVHTINLSDLENYRHIERMEQLKQAPCSDEWYRVLRCSPGSGDCQ